MCRTMNELEKVIADYRSLKALFIVAATTLMINYSELRCIFEHPVDILL